MFEHDQQTLVMPIGGFDLFYHSYTKPQMAYKTPVVIISGPLRGINTYSVEVEQLTKDYPVYLVEIPSFDDATGEILSRSESISLLKQFLFNLGIDNCTLMASSFNSLLIYEYAAEYPDHVESLIINGITKKLRDSVEYTLKESLEELDAGNMEQFASSVVLNFMNFSQKAKIPHSKLISENLYQKVYNLTIFEKRMIRAHIKKMMNLEGLGRSPQCPILFVTGEFDNFMTPLEAHQIAKNCPLATSVIIREADHMVGVEKKDVMTRLVRRFLNKQPLNRMKDVDMIDQKDFPRDKIRMEPRWLLNDVGFLDTGNGVFVPTNIVDINNFGCRLYTSFEDHRSLSKNDKLLLHFPEDNLKMEVILFKQTDNGHFRGVFQHRSFESTKRFEGFIDKVATTCSSAYAA
jgi:pimeloyl-ACP methyl ester carboxylesterase